MASRTKQKEEARARRLAEERAAAERAQRTRRMRMLGGVAGLAIVIAAVVIAISSSSSTKPPTASGPQAKLTAANLGPVSALGRLASSGNPGATGPEGVPVPNASPLAPAGSPSPGQSVDGISCQSGEQTLFHVHTHLTIFVNGTPKQIPAGVGISSPQAQQTASGPDVANGACFSWLHTHAGDGIIHIESPVQRTFTLGNFFDVWGQPLGPNQVGPIKGQVTAFYNGRHYIGDPQNIPLADRVQIQLNVGRPVTAPETISWQGTGL